MIPDSSDTSYLQLLDDCPDGIIVFDRRGIVRFANRATVELFGKSCVEIVDHPLPQNFSNGHDGEMLVAKSPGSYSIFDVRKNACIWQTETATLLSIRDITDQKYRQTAQMVEEPSRQQVEKWRSLESLAGGIAHQFNNLLMVILGNCYAMKRLPAADSSRDDRIGFIEKSSLRAIDITNHLLAFAGLGQFKFREINISKTIAGIQYIFETMALKKARMDYNLDYSIPLIYGDEAQLQRMLYEIVSNAIESISKVRGTIHITTGSLSLNDRTPQGNRPNPDLADGNYVYIQIIDNGCGMNEEVEARIFQPLFSTKGSSKGLGLSAALGIARSHKGTISVHTLPTHGTTMEIFLPAITAGKQDCRDEIIIEAETIVNSHGGRILIAEDEEYLRNILQETLEFYGYTITASEDGRDCLTKFDAANGQFDCIILDMMMPNLDGEDTLIEIRKRGSTVPVIIASGFTKPSTVDTLRSYGATFLQKPYKLEILMQEVATALHSHEAGIASSET